MLCKVATIDLKWLPLAITHSTFKPQHQEQNCSFKFLHNFNITFPFPIKEES